MDLPELMSRWNAQSPEQIVAKASNLLPFWLSLVLVIAIGYYLARIAWMLVPAGDEVLWAPPAQITTNRAAAQSGPATASFDGIVNAHLFGEAGAIAAPTPVEETDDAPDTRLNLTLRAAVAAEDAEFAHAIIADGSGEEKVYFIKSSVPGGATLHNVYPDRVILNRGGVLEALRLPREFKSGTVARRSQTTRTAPKAQRSVQQLIAENATNFTEIIRPQPFMPNGQLKGYRVFPGRNRQQFIALGLRPGDLVTAVNGVALNNPAQGMEIFRSLSDSTQVEVTVERNGQPETLTLDAEKFADAGQTTR